MLADIWATFSAAVRDSLRAADRPRNPEPMVIEEPAAVSRFSEGGATQAAMRSVYDVNARALSALIPPHGRLLDLGVGAGQALAYLMHRRPDITAVGVDLSPAMLSAAEQTLARQGLSDRIRLLAADITNLPPLLSDDIFSAISCLWTLHQLPDTEMLSAVLRQIAALRDRHGAAVWMLDFHRLASPRSFPALLAATEPGYPRLLRDDAIASEAAAFRRDEVDPPLRAAGHTDPPEGGSSPARLRRVRQGTAAPAGSWAGPWSRSLPVVYGWVRVTGGTGAGAGCQLTASWSRRPKRCRWPARRSWMCWRLSWSGARAVRVRAVSVACRVAWAKPKSRVASVSV
jgi:tRNA (cmo5U34)-methyltransferase